MNLAVDFGNLGRYGEAEKLLRKTPEIKLGLLPPEVHTRQTGAQSQGRQAAAAIQGSLL